MVTLVCSKKSRAFVLGFGRRAANPNSDPGISKMVTPGAWHVTAANKGVLAMLSRIFRFCSLGSSDDHHPNSDPGISKMVTPGAWHVTAAKNPLVTLTKKCGF
jgi:hypothetical protein